jgi:hypothetical protein
LLTHSRVESVTKPPSYNIPAASQSDDKELRTLSASPVSLRLDKQIPSTTVSIRRETSAVQSGSSAVPSVPVRPVSVMPDCQCNSGAGRAAFCVARHTRLPKSRADQQLFHWATLSQSHITTDRRPSGTRDQFFYP